MTWGFLLGYLLLQLLIGVLLSRRIQTEGDYFVGGRRLSTGVVALSLFATWFGAETCLGSSGAIYSEGLRGARADPFGYGLCLLLMGFLLAVPLHREGYMTLGDFYRRRFGPGVEKLAVVVLVPSSLIWAAAQIRAFGQVVSATMDVDVTAAIYLAAAFVIAYTFVGGLLGDVATDVLQGCIVAVSLLVMLWVGIDRLGGISSALGSIPLASLRLTGDDASLWSQMDRFAIPIFGSLVAQELVSRVVATRTSGSARRASFYSCGIYLLVGSSPVLLGLLGPTLAPGLEDPEELLPTLASRLLPSFWYAVFSCALISAILSTIDSVLLAAGALLSHNVLLPVLRVEKERSRLLVGRMTVALAGVFSLVVALYAEGIYRLVEMASAFGTAGVLVTTLIGIHSSLGGRRSATAALVTGLVTTPISEYLLEWEAPFLTSVAAALGAYLVVGLRTPLLEPHSQK